MCISIMLLILILLVHVSCLSWAACKGNVAIDTMWNKLKHENRRRASHLEQKCLRLRVSSMPGSMHPLAEKRHTIHSCLLHKIPEEGYPPSLQCECV